MGTFSIWHWLVLLLIFVPNLIFIPAVRKAGFSGWWVALSMIPIVGNILLWVFAYSKWPAFDQTKEFKVKNLNTSTPLQTALRNTPLDITSTDTAPASNLKQPISPSYPLKANFAASATATSTTAPDDLWAQALTEYDSGSRNQGLWARLFSEAQGNETLVKANYLRIRVDEMQQVIAVEKERLEAAQKATAAKEAELLEAMSAELRAYDALPKGICPNCKKTLLPLSAIKCTKCSALFGEHSAFKITELSKEEQINQLRLVSLSGNKLTEYETELLKRGQ